MGLCFQSYIGLIGGVCQGVLAFFCFVFCVERVLMGDVWLAFPHQPLRATKSAK